MAVFSDPMYSVSYIYKPDLSDIAEIRKVDARQKPTKSVDFVLCDFLLNVRLQKKIDKHK